VCAGFPKFQITERSLLLITAEVAPTNTMFVLRDLALNWMNESATQCITLQNMEFLSILLKHFKD
jgi:hypothetical protein